MEGPSRGVVRRGQTGLRLRELRYGNSPISRVPTQIFPFRITYAWRRLSFCG
jgi:hypothetical protein